jgi:macrodomain Ter protein organizer (MatP/YcbG family)
MKITRSLSIDIDVWEKATEYSRRQGMPFSVFVERSLLEEMRRRETPKPDIKMNIGAGEVVKK